MQTTVPRLLLEHAKARPDAPALREKEYGIWQTLTWSQLALLVRGEYLVDASKFNKVAGVPFGAAEMEDRILLELKELG